MKLPRLFTLSILASVCISPAFAAKPLDLNHQPMSVIQPYIGTNTSAFHLTLKEMRRSTDFNHTTHIHLKTLYNGYPIWGSDFIVHIPQGGDTSVTHLASNKNASMNGMIYQGIEKELGAAPASQADKALQIAIKEYQSHPANKQQTISKTSGELMVFVDKVNKAHWAYLVSFFAKPAKGLPAMPTMIIDASNFQIYHQWDNIQTADAVSGGGFGGNEKEGQFVYDSMHSNYPSLSIMRSGLNICYIQNSEVTVQNVNTNDAVTQFECKIKNPLYGSVYWDGQQDAVNGGYSPSNDALFLGKVVQEMYRKWYGVPALVDDQGNAMVLVMRVHEYMDNAYWDGSSMTFGDGITMFYPLVSLGVGAHEISHGFTQQHSNLQYWSQSGGINEAFSDMAAQGAEFYANSHNSWEIGPEIMKGDGALRYMDDPTKDCKGSPPGTGCSIDNVKDYYEGLDVHYSSGVFNKAFYLMGYGRGWNNTKKAFDVMVKANQDYWTPNTTFADAACGVLKAAVDYKYNTAVVKAAFSDVGIDLHKC
jgi:pseudolysin